MSGKLLIAATSAVVGFVSVAGMARAGVQITEFCSNTGSAQFSGKGEFVEFTNTGTTPVDMAGWSQDDSTRVPGKHNLSALGVLQPGESALLVEVDVDTFKTEWWGSVAAAPAGLKIIGPYTNDNLSSSGDEVNLYDNTGTLVDRVTYNGGPSAPAGGGPASGVTRNAPLGYAANTNSNFDFVNSFVGDSFGSFQAVGITDVALVGNPGAYVVPEPASFGLVAGAGLLVLRRRRGA